MARRVRPIRSGRLVFVLVLLALVLLGRWLARRPAPAPPGPGAGYLVGFWNVENLFDDRDDPGDRDEYEDWFARDGRARAAKLGLLAEVILAMDPGRGPDLLALVEVENRHAADLLRRTLNDRLPAAWRYPEAGLIAAEASSGRRIEPVILSRLPIRAVAGPPDFGGRRILAARVEARGAPLLVLVSHWTSRLRGEPTGARRADYGDALYGAFLAAYRADPRADVLIAGDFNDEPGDTSIRDHLRAVGDPGQVRVGGRAPYLLDLMAGRDPGREGTYRQGGRWEILDHLVASPGLLDPDGWQVRPETLRVCNADWLRRGPDGGPRRFGGASWDGPRGPSDHFALTVRLKGP